jgi:hypothetical protein
MNGNLVYICINKDLLCFDFNCCCMHFYHRSMLHQICISQISNGNVCQGLKIISSDDNIHLFLCMMGEGGKPISVSKLHSPTWELQWYFETYHGLQCIHSCTGNVANGYPNHWWYDHTDIMKDLQS